MHPLIRVLGKSVIQAASAKIATEMAKPESKERLALAAEQLAARARSITPANAVDLETKMYAGIRALGNAFANARRRPPDGS